MVLVVGDEEADQLMGLAVFTLNDGEDETAELFLGIFRSGNKPPVLLGVREGFSKAKTGELKASPRNLAKR